MTLIEYTPDMDKSSVPVLIPVMSSLQPTPGKSELMKCCPLMLKGGAASLYLHPLPGYLAAARSPEQIENRSTTRNGVINITFSVAPGTDFRTLDLNKLRFWLGNDDNYTRDQLYLWFCEYLQGADLTVGEQHLRLPEFMLKAVGFEPQDAMLPRPKNVHSGYRILQEYFCYPDAFLFLIFVVVRLCLTDCRRNSLPCNCVFAPFARGHPAAPRFPAPVLRTCH